MFPHWNVTPLKTEAIQTAKLNGLAKLSTLLYEQWLWYAFSTEQFVLFVLNYHPLSPQSTMDLLVGLEADG